MSSSDPDSVAEQPRRFAELENALRRIAKVLVPAFFVARVLAVDLAGVVTNDSIGYFARAADDPFGQGLIVQGYRQVAQALWIVVTDFVASIGGWDRIFSVALLQRSVLLVGLGLIWYALRFWSVPVLMILTTPTYVVHSDFVLPEGFLIPWCSVAVGLAATVAVNKDIVNRFPLIVASASGAIAFMLSTIKLQYTSLLCLTAAVVWVFWRGGQLRGRSALIVLAVPFTLSATLALAQSFENQRELGVFEPVSERARAEWYGAWQATFVVDKENRTDPTLAEWFDEGNLYTFLKGTEAEVSEYPQRVELVNQRIDAMFEAAGTSSFREQFRSFLGGYQGGRTDDVGGIVNRALESTSTDLSGRVTRNYLGREGGVPVIQERINENRPVGFVATSTVFRRFGRLYEDYRPAKAWMGVVANVTLLLSLLHAGRHRPFVLGAFALVTAVSAALGSAYIDNARYLLGPLTIVLVTATLAVRSVVLERWTLRGST